MRRWPVLGGMRRDFGGEERASVSGSEMSDLPTMSPTVGRRWLAQELRRLREAAGLKQADVAGRLRCKTAKVGHIESMRNPISGPDLEVVLPFLGVPADRVDWYLRLADLAQEKGWWDGHRAVPSWFSLYIGLEWGASEVHEWHLGYVPGLLQTREYASAVIRSGIEASEQHFQEQTELRLQRQQSLWRDEAPLRLHAIIDEAVLHRVVGNPEIMREQLDQLARAGQSSHVVLQVVPFGAGLHGGQLGSFQWLSFPREEDLGVVYMESQLGGLYLEDASEVATFRAEFEKLQQLALSHEDSRRFIAEMAREEY